SEPWRTRYGVSQKHSGGPIVTAVCTREGRRRLDHGYESLTPHCDLGAGLSPRPYFENYTRCTDRFPNAPPHHPSVRPSYDGVDISPVEIKPNLEPNLFHGGNPLDV